MAEDLIFKIGANVEGFSAAMSDMSSTLGGAVKGIFEQLAELNPAFAGVIAAIGGIGFAAVEAAESFETARNKIIAGTGAVGDNLKDLEGDFSAVFVNVPQSATEVGSAIASISTRLDLAGESLEKATKGFLSLSTILGESTEPLIKTVTQSMNAWGISAENVEMVQDKLLVIHEKTGAAVTVLADALRDGEPVLTQWGLSWDQAAGLLGDFEKNGVNSESVVNALKIAIKKLGDDTPPSLETLQGLMLAIENGTINARQATDLFGRSGVIMFETIKEGKIHLDNHAAALANAKGETDRVLEATDTMGRHFEILKNQLADLLTPLGLFIVKIGENLATALQSAVGAIKDFNLAFPGLVSGTNALVTGLDGLIPGLGTAISLFGQTKETAKQASEQFNVTADATAKLAEQHKAASDAAAKQIAAHLAAEAAAKVLAKAVADAEKDVSELTKAQKDGFDVTDALDAAHRRLTTALQAQHPEWERLNRDFGDALAAWNLFHQSLAPGITGLSLMESELRAAQAAEEAARVKFLEGTGTFEDYMKKTDLTVDALERLRAEQSGGLAFTSAFTEANNKLTTEIQNQKLEIDPLTQAFKDMGLKMEDPLKSANALADAFKTLGIATHDFQLKSSLAVQQARDDAKAALDEILSSNITSFEQRRQATEAYLKTEIAMYVQQGQDVPAALQIQLAQMSQAEKDYQANSVHGWETMVNNIRGAMDGMWKSFNHDLITANWSDFESSGLKALENIGEAIATKIFKPWEDQLSSFVTTKLTALLSNIPGLGSLGSIGMGPTTPGINGNPINLGGIFTGSDPGGLPGVDGMPGIDLAQPSGALNSAMGSLTSSITSIAGAVGSVASAVAGFMSNAQLDNMKQTLNYMHNDTAYMAWRGSVGGEHDAVLDTRNILNVIFPTLMEARDDTKAVRWAAEQSAADLNELTTILAGPPVQVTVQGNLIGLSLQELAAAIGTIITQNMALQGT